MELRQFRYFVAVAEELHFSRAAERLNIGQPPLSLQIQSIERELGVLLFQRNRRKVELTPAGKLFLEEARLTLLQASRAIDTAKRAARGEVGTLRLSYITSIPLVDMFTRAIRGFRAAMPEVHLELKIQSSQNIIDAILLNTIDVGLTRPAAHTILPKGIESITVLNDKLMLVLPVDHPLARSKKPVSIADLKSERFVLRPRGTGVGFYEQVFAMCDKAGFSPTISQEAVEATTTMGLVAAGVGITIAPQALQNIRIHDIVWRDLAEEEDAASKILLIYNINNTNPLRDRFVERIH